MDKTSRLLNSLKSRPQIQSPIASDMFLPNSSGVPNFIEDKNISVASLKVLDDSGYYAELNRTDTANAFTIKNKVSVPGVTSYSVNFDGTDDYINIPDHADFNFGTGSFTIMWWEKRGGVVDNRPSICRDGGQPFTGYLLGWSASGVLGVYMSSDGANWDIASAKTLDPAYSTNWTHYAITRSGNTFTTYKNGVQVDTWTSALGILNGVGDVQIGMYQSTLHYDFWGKMDELRFYKGRCLTSTEILADYNTGSGTYGSVEAGLIAGYHFNEGSGSTTADYSGNNHTATLNYDVTWTTGDKANQSASIQEITFLTFKDGSGSSENGKIIIGSLPTADPHVVGQLWNNSGVLTISAG